jgi:eukaryotic-like serine/threonine-protein kinase
MLGESVRRRQAPGKRPRRSNGRRNPWRTLLWAVPLAALLPFVVGYLLAVYVIFPPEQAGDGGVPVPALAGMTLTDARAELAVAGLGSVDVTELPHPTAPSGVVVAQSPLPGQQLRPGAGVRLAVSRGLPRVRVPDVQGFGADRAAALLRTSGFQVARETQESPVPEGRVIATEPAGGQEVALPATVMVWVSSGLPVMVPDTLPPDTIAPAGGG